MSTPANTVNTNIRFTKKQTFQFTFYEFGYNLIYTWVSSFLLIYYTDTIGVAAAAVSTLTLVVRLFDAINDPIIGSWADRTESKWGRYKPWVGLGGIGLAFATALLFAASPAWSNGGKIVWMWIMYILVTVASTCTNVTYHALNTVVTTDAKQRMTNSGLRMFIGSIGGSVAGMLAVPAVALASTLMKQSSSTSAPGYFVVIAICCVIGIFPMMSTARTAKEVVHVDNTVQPPMKKRLSCFFRNPYMLMVAASFLLLGCNMYGTQAIMMYYFTYFLGNPALYSLASMIGLVGSLLGSAVIVNLVYKVTKHKGKTMVLLSVIGAVSYFLMYLDPNCGILFWIGRFVSGLTCTACITAGFGMLPDACDYSEYKIGIRADGLLAALASLLMKTGGALAPAVMLALIDGAGYVPNAVQNASVMNILNMCSTIIPAVLSLLVGVCFLFYKLDDKKHSEIVTELAERHAAVKE